MDGSRTITGAVVFPRWTPSLSLRFSPLVRVQPGETTVRRVILDPPWLAYSFSFLNFYF